MPVEDSDEEHWLMQIEIVRELGREWEQEQEQVAESRSFQRRAMAFASFPPRASASSSCSRKEESDPRLRQFPE